MKHLPIACGFLLILSSIIRADEPTVVDVWSGKPPCETRKGRPEKSETSGGITRISNVFKPTLTIYHAPKDKDMGASVIICPGGGYSILAWDLEGIEVAQRLNCAGVTGIILKYRVPSRLSDDVHGFISLTDAQRAISLTRSNAKQWGIDPKRIGILGFSAGGNLTALACTNFDKRSYDVSDDVDKTSCRPDFGVLVYPAYLTVGKSEKISPNLPISKDVPPMFITGAKDDKITNVGCPALYQALKDAGVPTELQMYETGGHGYGLRPNRPCSSWPQKCEEWMKGQGLLTK